MHREALRLHSEGLCVHGDGLRLHLHRLHGLLRLDGLHVLLGPGLQQGWRAQLWLGLRHGHRLHWRLGRCERERVRRQHGSCGQGHAASCTGLEHGLREGAGCRGPGGRCCLSWKAC